METINVFDNYKDFIKGLYIMPGFMRSMQEIGECTQSESLVLQVLFNLYLNESKKCKCKICLSERGSYYQVVAYPNLFFGNFYIKEISLKNTLNRLVKKGFIERTKKAVYHIHINTKKINEILANGQELGFQILLSDFPKEPEKNYQKFNNKAKKIVSDNWGDPPNKDDLKSWS